MDTSILRLKVTRLETSHNMSTKLTSSLCLNLARATLSFVLLLIAVACVRPAVFGFGEIGLDSSWMAAVSYAVGKQFVFGSEIVFTSGPLQVFTTGCIRMIWRRQLSRWTSFGRPLLPLNCRRCSIHCLLRTQETFIVCSFPSFSDFAG